MTDRSVAIRLATDGKQQVKQDLVEIGDTGDAQARRWQKSYDQAGAVIDAAIAKQQQAAQKLAAITPATSTQQIYQAGASTNYDGASARDSAAALKQLLDEQDRLDASAAALKARIDPLSVAQAKFDAELANANALLAVGKISQAEYAADVALSQQALNRATQTLGGHSNALGFNRTQFIIAEGAAHRYVDSILAGMSPMRAFVMQAGDVGNILAMDDNGVAGGLAKVKALINPTSVGIAALTAVVLVGAAAWYSYEAAIAKLDGLSQGAGRVLGESGEELEANAEAAADAGSISVKAARDIETSYLQIAKSGDVLVGLTAITQDFATATGQDAKAAAGELGSAFSDPIQGAQELTDKYGLLTQAQIEHIAKLVEEGQQTQAQTELLNDISGAVRGAAEQVTGLAAAWQDVQRWASNAFTAMGKAANEGTGAFFRSLGSEGLAPAWFQQPPSAHNDNGAAANQARQRAQAASDKYTGANGLDDITKTVGTLQAGIAAGGTPQQIAQWTAALQANQHALETWIPAQDKANQLAQIDAKIAAAKTPAQKQALAAQRETLELAGQVITSQDASTRATDAGNKALAEATKHSGAHAASLARQAESMEVAAKASLDLADAYLKSDAAGVEADAQRKASTDATRKGIDVAAQAQRQLNLDIAQGVANGAKSVAQLRDETAAREAVNAQVSGGTLAASQMNQALSDEEALRPLLTLKAVAQGEALKELIKVIDAYIDALQKSHEAEAHADFLGAVDQSKTNVADLKAGIADLTLSPRDQAINAARRTATNYAADHQYSAGDTAAYVDQKGQEAAANFAADIARYADQTYRSNQDNLKLVQTEADTLGMSANQRELILDHLERENELKEKGLPLDSDAAKALLAQGDALDAANVKLKAMNDNWQEVTQFGNQFLSDVLDPQNWTSWGNLGKKVLGDLETEFIKLALLNPLENFLFGEANPTLGSIGGVLGHLFGHNASGTQNWAGGPTWVAENGPELINLPAGAKVTPASETRRVLAANENRPSQLNVTLTLSDDLNARIDSRSTNVALAVTRNSAPTIVQAATANTINQLTRPRL